jgi:hypothetical protein
MSKAKGPYRIHVLDAADCIIGETEEETLKEATRSARHSIQCRDCIEAGMHKAEVIDSNDVCVFDCFVRKAS